MLYAEKIIEEVVQLHNTSTGRIHFMVLIILLLDEQCLGSALSILREIIWRDARLTYRWSIPTLHWNKYRRLKD